MSQEKKNAVEEDVVDEWCAQRPLPPTPTTAESMRTWFYELCGLVEADDCSHEVHKAVVKTLFNRYGLVVRCNQTFGQFNDTILTCSGYSYPEMFITLMDLMDEFHIDTNQPGDSHLPIYWVMHCLLTLKLNQRRMDAFIKACIRCLDATDDCALRLDSIENRQNTATISRKLESLAVKIHYLDDCDKKQSLIKFFTAVVERIHDDQSGIVLRSALPDPILPTGEIMFLIQQLKQHQQRQFHYRDTIQTTLMSVLSPHPLSHCVPLIDMIRSYSWISVLFNSFCLTVFVYDD